MAKRSTGTAAEDLAKLLLRLVLGSLLLLHGAGKLLHGVAPIKGMIAAHGLPGFLGYAVLLGEVVAPVLLILGVWTRVGGLLVVANMTVAVLLVHTRELFTLGPQGGWALELQAFYFFTGLALALLGAGRFSLGGPQGRWN
jgi:putative oxidoreductase